LSVRPILVLFAALSVAALNIAALGAHYGTEPPVPPINSAMLSLTDQPSLCASSKGHCVETTGSTRAYPVADGDRITLFWSSDPDEVDGVIHLGKLFLPLYTQSSTSVAPVTIEVDMPTGTAATVIVEYAGTRHHVPLTTGVWQPITLYNPDERTLYVLFQPPPQPPPN
jgi:hypothetical protein